MPVEDDITYVYMRRGDEEAIVDLVLRVFDANIAPLYSPEGVEEFRKYVTPESLGSRAAANHFVLVASAGGWPVGMIEVRDYRHVSLLFVDGSHQRKGIARTLLTRAVEQCRGKKPDLDEITVNSSPNSVEVYRRLGFSPKAPEMTVNGIRFTPMALRLGVRDGEIR